MWGKPTFTYQVKTVLSILWNTKFIIVFTRDRSSPCPEKLTHYTSLTTYLFNINFAIIFPLPFKFSKRSFSEMSAPKTYMRLSLFPHAIYTYLYHLLFNHLRIIWWRIKIFKFTKRYFYSLLLLLPGPHILFTFE